MRALLALALVVLTACAAKAEGESASSEGAIVPEMQNGSAEEFPETVQILHGNGEDYCTGVLVSDRVVLGAAHCIWGTAYAIKAPYAPGAPTRKVVRTNVITRDYSRDVAKPDIGMLVLDAPIALEQYAVPTEIGGEADGGRTFRGIAVGRERAARTAPLVRSKELDVTSGKPFGYTTGLRTPYFSTGGDSGGPLFLVENGRVTHKVVAVERQPDPDANADWFTRVDAAVLTMLRR
jgi:secreted trypsin-like serine protease